jgi:sodium/potassium-transporting ATPase subunit beta
MSDGKGKSNHYSPVKQQDKGGFRQFLWNSETSEFLGRTGSSWCKITFFYICFFTGLAAFFGLMLFIFYKTLDLEKPRWVGKNGLIGGNPGVGFRPMPDQDKNVESTLIWVNRANEQNQSYWADEIDVFVQKYKNTSSGNGEQCSFKNDKRATEDTFCFVDIDKMKGCVATAQDKYGYTGGISKPCVLIKLNKIYGWKPEPYKTERDLKLAEERKMPKDLIERIRNLQSNDSSEFDKRELDTVWVSCEGENPADKENMGPINFYAPGIERENFPGIPGYYFPYLKQNGYHAPFVFVRFENPQVNVLIQIECKAWAKNIEADRQLRLGSVHFELMLD